MSSSGSQSHILNAAASVSYFNLLGIASAIVLLVIYIALSAHAIKYLKTFATKIKIIVNRAEDKELNKKHYMNFNSKVKTPQYIEMEDALLNEVRVSRSPFYFNVLACLLQKYDHVVFYPFRRRILNKIELLRPKASFYAMLDIASMCVAWISTILLSSLLQQMYQDLTKVTFGMYIGLTVAICIISSLISIIIINRFFRLYELNIKNSFKRDYGKNFLKIEEGLEHYKPDDSQELEEIRMYQEIKKGKKMHDSRSQMMEEAAGHTSQRKLLNEMSNRKRNNRILLDRSSIKEEDNEEDQDESVAKQTNDNMNNSLLAQKIMKYMGGQENKIQALSNLFVMHKEVEGFQNAENEDKYLFIEDKHHIGDEELLGDEALKGENKSNFLTFVIMFGILGMSTVFCCYLNYQFQKELSKKVFIMFTVAFVADLFVLRVLIMMIVAFFKCLISLCKGYKSIDKKKRVIKNKMGQAIKDMFKKDNRSRASMEIKEYENFVKKIVSEEQGLNNTKQLHTFNEDGNELMDNFHTKRDDDGGDGSRIQNPGLSAFAALLKNGDENKSFDKTQNSIYNNTQQNLKQTPGQKGGMNEEEEADYLQKHKNIANELADYNLLIFRKIFDSYGEKQGERVFKQFRTDRHNVLRKKYLTPIVNPNYDYNKLLKDLKQQQQENEIVDESPRKLKGEEKGEGEDLQNVNGQNEEMNDPNDQKKFEREQIDRFGKKLRDGQEETLAMPQPLKGIIEMEMEEEIEEEDVDEWSKKMKELAYLRAKKKRGEQLTDEEEKRLVYLEKEEDAHRHKDIEKLDHLGNKRSNDESNKLNQLLQEEDEYRERRIQDLLDKEMSSEGIDEEEKVELKMLLDWQNKKKRKLLEELRLKKKNGTITEEELRLLKELEEWEWEQKLKELEMLRDKVKRGISLTEEEKRRLKELEQEELERKLKELEDLRRKLRDGTITEEERLRLAELERWAEEMRLNELEELRRKLKNGTLTDEERRRLQQLEDEELQRKLDELEMLRERARKGLLTEEEKRRLAELEEWDRKRKLKILEDQENKRLKEIEEMLKKFYDKGVENLTDTEKLNMLELELEKCEILRNKLLRTDKDDMTDEIEQKINDFDEQIENLEYEILLLKQKLGLLNEKDLQRLKEIETKRKMNDLSMINKNQEEDDVENPFDQQNIINEEFKQKIDEEQKGLDEEEQQEETEEDKLSQDSHFSKLPPIEVMNKLNDDDKSKTPSQKQQTHRSEQQINEEEEEHSEDQEQKNKQQDQEEDRNSEDLEQRKQRELEEEEERRRLKEQRLDQQEVTSPKSAMKSIQDERAQTAKSNVRFANDDQLEISEHRASEGLGAGAKSPGKQIRESDEEFQKDSREELEFGHDDLELGVPPGPQIEADESIYSHKTSAILDEEKVSFMHIEHLPNQDNASDDSFSEQDMVYYNKDDLTNYSKGLGLNKVPKKNLPQATSPDKSQKGSSRTNLKNKTPMQYYSENDIQEMQVEEGEGSDQDASVYSIDSQGRRYKKRGRRGMGQIRHNDLEIQSYNDQIDGRVRVDDWNLNYRGKKKKLKKKKVNDKTKRRMQDLQDIYGVDAKTLAGLQKGHHPWNRRAVGAGGGKGKGKGDIDGDDLGGGSRYGTDMSFRSTQNTFMKQSQLGGHGPQGTHQKSIDAQSNMFSFNGGKSVMSKRWGDIESTLKGSKLNQFSGGKGSGRKQFPPTAMKKLTSTQQNFNNIPGHLEEESKSEYNRSNGSFQRGVNTSARKPIGKQGKGFGQGGHQKKQSQTNAKGKGVGNGKKTGKGDDTGLDSYSESDEGVYEGNALFQSRDEELHEELFGNSRSNNKKKSGNKKKTSNNQHMHTSGGMNDELIDYHSESDEGVNQGNPVFDSNDQFIFKKRNADSSIKKRHGGNKNTSNKAGSGSRSRKGGVSSMKRESDQDMEDLEAQDFGKNRKNNKKSNSKQKYVYKSSDEDGNLFGLQSKTQNRQNEFSSKKSKKVFESDGFGGASGIGANFNRTKQSESISPSKPPKPQGTGQKIKATMNKFIDREDDATDDENDHARIKFQQQNQRSEYNNFEEYKAANRGGAPGGRVFDYKHGSDNEAQERSQKKNKKQNKQINRQQKHHGSDGRRSQLEDDDDEDDENPYIIGPDSTQTMIRNKDQGKKNQRNQQDRYMRVYKDTEFVEDLDAEDGDNQFAKKRKVRKAAQSTNYRDSHQARLEQQRLERLRRRQLEEEKALVKRHYDGDGGSVKEKSLSKMKKKKQKKEMVRKEVNYWLDYDSPYAEYLVARFREWSPNPNGQPSSRSSSRRQVQKKYSEVSNLYGKNNQSRTQYPPERNSQSRSKNNSISPARFEGDAVQVTKVKDSSKKFNVLSDNEIHLRPFDSQKQVNNLFAEDYEEP